jgi:hypothetical protein
MELDQGQWMDEAEMDLIDLGDEARGAQVRLLE